MEVVVEPGIGQQARCPFLGGHHRLEGLDRGTCHHGLGAVELLTQAVELIEQIQVQLRKQLVASDDKLQLGDPDRDLLLHDVGIEAEHLGQAGVPVGLEPGLRGRGHRDDPPIIGRRQAQQVAHLPLGGQQVGRPGDQVEAELLEPLLGFGDVGDRPLAHDELRLLAVDDFPGQVDRLLGAPELDVLAGQDPVLLLDRTNQLHDVQLEVPDALVGLQPGDDDRGPVRLEPHQVAEVIDRLARQGRTSHQGLGQGHLDVRGVDRRIRHEKGAVLVQPVDVVNDTDLSTSRCSLREPDLEIGRVLNRDDRRLGSAEAQGTALNGVVERLRVLAPGHLGCECGVEDRQSLGDLRFLDRRVINAGEASATQHGLPRSAAGGCRREERWLEALDRDALGTEVDHANDLGIVQPDPDRLLKGHRPDFLRLRDRWWSAAWQASAAASASCYSKSRPA